MGWLRLVALLEGLSLILLLFVAMPLKYAAGEPAMVKYVGMAHGILFILFILMSLWESWAHRWKFSVVTWKVLASSLVPFGTFYIDRTVLEPLHKTMQ
jgi:integral membrane protein